MKDKKKYVLMVSKKFLSGHPRAGQDTDFKNKIYNKEKIHTIRANYKYWEKIAMKVNNGNGVLILKQWIGRPYYTNQEEILRLEKMSVQPLSFKSFQDLNVLAKNDGLSTEDFKSWFKGYDLQEVFCIIHFTDFKYNTLDL